MKMQLGRKLVDLKVAGAVIVRAPNGEIGYSSGRLYFDSIEQFRVFKHKMLARNNRAIVKRIYIKKAKPPEFFHLDTEEMNELMLIGNTYCPYCGSVEHWNFEHHCPICGMSDEDFYIKAYNGSWRRGLKNAPQD